MKFRISLKQDTMAISENNLAIGDVKARREDVQYLRALAVVIVILFHISASILPNGYLGVDIFFVLSGFVMGPQLSRFLGEGPNTFMQKYSNFLLKRFWRLIPALSITSLVFGLMLLLLIDASEVMASMKQLLLSNLGIGNLGAYILSGDYFSPHGNGFLHLWSLSTELQIYLITPILFSILGKVFVFSPSRFLIVPVMLTTLSLFYFVFSSILSELLAVVHIVDVNNLLWYYSPAARMWEFLIGFLIWRLNLRQKTRMHYSIRYFSLAILFLLIFSDHLLDTKVEILATVLLTSSILIGQGPKLRGFFFEKISRLGDISYSVYLVHLPIIYLLQNSTNSSKPANLLVEISITLAGSLAIGYLFYSLVEQRLNFSPIATSARIRVTVIGLSLQLAPILFVSLFLINITPFKSFTGLPQGEIGPTWIWDNQCENYQDPRSSKPIVCSYGDQKEAPKLLLIGDSHAAVISKKFVNLALQEKFNPSVSTFEGCPYFSRETYDKTPLLFKNSACRDHNRVIQEWVEQEKPFAIFYVFRGPIAYSPNDSRLSDKSFSGIVLEEITKLSEGIAKIAMFIPIPEWQPHSLIDSIARRGKILDDRSKFDRELWLSSRVPEKITLLDPYPVICPGSICNLSEDGRFKYRDANHLSEYGANLVGTLIAKEFKSIQTDLSKEQNR